jgi:steroid 5-alpha reductase family enzyme
MTLMFLFISIPWIEKKILSTRPQYSEYQKAVNILLPEITFFKKLFR